METAEGEEECSQRNSRHISIARTRGRERSSVRLSLHEQNALPSTSERITLTLNGLGEKKLLFPCNGNAAQVQEVIIDAFPALQTAGGYEVLRTADGRSKALICIPTPVSGISVAFLKSVLGQAKGPLQKDIFIRILNSRLSYFAM